MLLATDAHHPRRRPPLLAEARDAAAALVGAEEAGHMVVTRPAGILANAAPETLPPPLFRTEGFRPITPHSGKDGSGLRRFLRKLSRTGT
jgi:protein-tyrosine phosphatase